MRKLIFSGIILLAGGFANAGQCYVNKSEEVSALISEMKSQKVFPDGDGSLLGYLLLSLNNKETGVLEMHKKLMSSYIQASLAEIKSRKLQTELKKVAMKQLEAGFDQGKYSQADGLEIWERSYAPRISEIVNGRQNLLSRILKELDNAEVASCLQTK